MNPELISLHRYWVHANRLREHFGHAISNPEWLELAKVTGSTMNPMAVTLAFMLHDPGIFMMCWYGSLYTVVEGWQELKLSDPAVDELIASPNVKLLKRFRNGVYHYQKNYFDERFTDFTAAEEAVPWVHDLTNAIGAYFRRLAGDAFPVLSPEFRQKFRDVSFDGEKAIEVIRLLQSQSKSEIVGQPTQNRVGIDLGAASSNLPLIREIVIDELGRRMSDLSETAFCAGWLHGLEDRLPALCDRTITSGIAQPFGATVVSLETAHRLLALSAMLGHWVVPNDKGGYQPFPTLSR